MINKLKLRIPIFFEPDDGGHADCIRAKDRKLVAVPHPDELDFAYHMIHCVNMHDELVEALEKAVCEPCIYWSDDGEKWCCCYKGDKPCENEQLLTRAKGKE